jgi:hypothetical protein
VLESAAAAGESPVAEILVTDETPPEYAGTRGILAELSGTIPKG